MSDEISYFLATLLAFAVTFCPPLWALDNPRMDWLQKLVIVFCCLAAFGPYTAKAIGGWYGMNIYVAWFFGIVAYVIPGWLLYLFSVAVSIWLKGTVGSPRE